MDSHGTKDSCLLLSGCQPGTSALSKHKDTVRDLQLFVPWRIGDRILQAPCSLLAFALEQPQRDELPVHNEALHQLAVCVPYHFWRLERNRSCDNPSQLYGGSVCTLSKSPSCRNLTEVVKQSSTTACSSWALDSSPRLHQVATV